MCAMDFLVCPLPPPHCPGYGGRGYGINLDLICIWREYERAGRAPGLLF